MQADKILGGKTGVSLLGSDLSGEDIHLKASYQVKVPVAIFGIHGLPMQQTVCLRKWTGKRDAADKGALVLCLGVFVLSIFLDISPVYYVIVCAAAGILLFPTFSGTPEEAALAFLGGTVARDPNNKCNACGFQSSCSLSGKGGCGRD